MIKKIKILQIGSINNQKHLGYYLEKFYAEHGRITNDDL
jgi:hypothetical protein